MKKLLQIKFIVIYFLYTSIEFDIFKDVGYIINIQDGSQKVRKFEWTSSKCDLFYFQN